ncbi:MAG: hypothetical protein ACON4Z_18030 [Planctomycetota bacterium]
MSGCPSHLVFDEEPSPEQLSVLLGPDVPAVRAVICEDDERVTVAQRRVPVVALAIFLVCFAALLTSAPFWSARFGYAVPSHVEPALLWTMAAALWLLIVPSMIAIFWFAQRAAQEHGPGAVVDKRTGALSLPWIDAVVPAGRLVRFVHLRCRRRVGSHVQPVGQHAALFRDEDGRHVYAPFARLITRRLGRTPSQRLADLFDVSVQQVDAGLL